MATEILNIGTQVLSDSTTETGVNFTGGLLQKGEIISGWKIIEKMNTQSGEADIYIAEKEEEKGIIKYYRSKIKPKTEILENIKGLQHADIVNLYDYGTYQERFYEIMEYAAGGSLDTKKADGAYKYLPLSEEQVIQTVQEVINSFKTCHEKGIIHRDIKPANLYYRNADGSDIIIGDFGISSIMDETEKLHKTQTTSRTTGYAAPEVLSGIITPKMDYYALGITLWELLTGKDPFTFDNGKRRNDAHLIRDTIEGRIADDILSKEPILSKSMQHLIRGLLVIDPDNRWGHDEVTRHLAGEDVPVHQKAKKEISFKIGETVCTSLEQIGSVIIENTESSQRYIFRGLLAAYLEDDYPEISEKISKIAEESSASNDQYNGLLQIAYLLNPAMSFKLNNGFTASSMEDIVFLLENAPETLLSLLKEPNSKLFTYLTILNYADKVDELNKMIASLMQNQGLPDVELLGKTTVILKDNIIKPFKLARYADFELSTLDQIKHVPKDMQQYILEIISNKSYEGNFLPWLDLMTPAVSVDEMKTDSWSSFLASIQ